MKSILVLILLLRFNPWKIFQLVNRMFFLSGPEMVLFVIGLFMWCGEMLSRFDLIRTCQQRLFFFHHLHHSNYQNCLCSSYIYNFLPLGNGLLAENVNMARTHFSMTSEIFSLDLKMFYFLCFASSIGWNKTNRSSWGVLGPLYKTAIIIMSLLTSIDCLQLV